MGATPDYNKPLWANPIDTDLDAVRNNFHFLMCQVATGIPILPGWSTTVDVATNSNYAKPDGYVLSHADGRKIYINLVWNGTLISKITLGYNDGVSGLVWFDPVTLTIEGVSAFTTTAKAFGGSTNYYELGMTTATSPKVWQGGLIPSTGSGDIYQKMTLVFCVYPNELDWKPIFGSGDQNYDVSINDVNGGITIYRRTWTNLIKGINVAASGSPTDYGGMAANEWHAVMISYNGDQTVSPQEVNIEVWIDGVEVYNGPWGSAPAGTNPMDYIGPCYVGFGKTYNGNDRPGLDCYLSYIWANEEYLDPNTYWSSFFDAGNKPKNIGADGSSVTGSQPVTYVPDGDFTNNLGSSYNWVEIGTVPAAPSSPTD